VQQYQRRLDKDLRLRVGEMRQRFSELATSYVFRQPAELIRQYQQQVDDLRHRLSQATGAGFETQRARLDTASEKFKLLSPQARVTSWKQRLDSQQRRFESAFGQFWQATNHRLQHASGKLELLSPKSTLSRGYSITTLADSGRLVRSVSNVASGTKILTKLLDGEFNSVVSSRRKLDESQ